MVLQAGGGKYHSYKTLPHERALCDCIAASWCVRNALRRSFAAPRSTAALLPPSIEGATRGFQEVS